MKLNKHQRDMIEFTLLKIKTYIQEKKDENGK